MTGLFVVFEGGDGVGKSYQSALLAAWLTDAGVPVELTREPGGTASGRRMREILLAPETGDLAPRAEALLFAADKAQHVHELIAPALARGAVVISDRYVDSTLAYQGAGRVLEPEDLVRINRWATGGLRPDVTVLMDRDPAHAVARLTDKDRMESAGADLHARARAKFLELAAEDPARYLVVDAAEGIAANAREIRDRVKALLAERSLVDAGGAPRLDVAAPVPELSEARARMGS